MSRQSVTFGDHLVDRRNVLHRHSDFAYMIMGDAIDASSHHHLRKVIDRSLITN